MITVFGSINVDLVCRVERIPEAGETVHGSDYELIPGGKGANQALAARRAGAEVRMVGAIGTDAMAASALPELRAGGVDLDHVAVREGANGVALINVDASGENAIVIAPGANARLTSSDAPPFDPNHGGAVLMQMEVPFPETVSVARAAREAGIRTVLSIAPFSPLSEDDLAPFGFILVNEHEAADLARAYGLSAVSAAATVEALAKRLGKTVIATLGPQGAVAYHDGAATEVPAIPVEVVDTTGAGDTFAGAFAAFLDEGLEMEPALRRAAIAGSLACTRHGAQPSFPTRAEIDSNL